MDVLVRPSPLMPNMVRLPIAGSLQAGLKVLASEDLRALREAEAIVARAQEEAERIKTESGKAYEIERQRGYQEGRAQAQAQQALHMIEHVTRHVDFLGKVESRMVDLVMQALRKIIDGFDDRTRVLMTVRSVLATARTQKQVTLRLHPDQAEAVRAQVGVLLERFPGVDFLDVVDDARQRVDTCVMESEIGQVEASIDTQMEALRSAFRKTLGTDAEVPRQP